MTDLKAMNPAAGLLPLEIGKARLTEMEPGHLTSLTAFDEGMGRTLEEKHGLAWPAPNRATGKEGARCIWFGLREVMLLGPVPDRALGSDGALVDQSDAWTVVSLEGAAAEDVLARLVPVDLRAAHFKRGHTVRTQIFHMNASITRVGADRFMLMVFRSMAQTLIHDLKQAMAAVAARG